MPGGWRYDGDGKLVRSRWYWIQLESERRILMDVLRSCKGDFNEAAALLEIDPSRLRAACRDNDVKMEGRPGSDPPLMDFARGLRNGKRSPPRPPKEKQ